MIPKRDRIKTVMTTAEIAAAFESGDYSAEMLMQHLIRHHNRLERERNDARAIIDATLKALPVGYIPAHTPESLPGRVADLVTRIADAEHEAKRLEAELETFDETAIEWWCEYQDLKAKARES